MIIRLDCETNENDWHNVTVGEWLTRHDKIVIKLDNWSVADLLKRFDVRLQLRSGKAALYQYFPFAFKFSGDVPQAEIGEIVAAEEGIEFVVEQVAPDRDGYLRLQFASEQSGIPIRVGLGPDDRQLALLVDSIGVRRAPEDVLREDALPIARQKGLDLDLNYSKGSPIFIVGSGRCGTSILTWALGQHPNIAYTDETVWMPMTLYGAVAGYQMAGTSPLAFLAANNIDLDRFIQYVGAAFDRMHHDVFRSRAQSEFLKRLSGRANGFNSAFQLVRSNWCPKRRWVDGTPLNTGAVPILARAFPNAKFIGIIREPRSVIASFVKFRSIGGLAYSPEQASLAWLQAAWMILWAHEKLGRDRVKIVDYSEFANPARLIRDILYFVSEPNAVVCRKPFQTTINSSQVSDEDLKSIDNPLLERCATIYANIGAGHTLSTIDWGSDVISPNYDEWFQDMINRLVKVIS